MWRGSRAAQLHALVDAAEAYGSGRIEITNRANFQLRGFAAQTVPAFTEAMRAAGLASADPAAERRRNILVAAGLEPDMMVVAQRLEAWLEQDGALRALPAKFGYAVGVVADVADLCLLPNRVVLPGHVAVPAADPVVMAQALTAAFLRLAPGLTPRPTRLRGLLAAIGLEALGAAAGLEGQDFAPVAFEPHPGGGSCRPRSGLAWLMMRTPPPSSAAPRSWQRVLAMAGCARLSMEVWSFWARAMTMPAWPRRRGRRALSPIPPTRGGGSKPAWGGRAARVRGPMSARSPPCWHRAGPGRGCCMSRAAPKAAPRPAVRR